MSQTKFDTPYQFEQIQVDPGALTMTRNGRTKKLEPKVIDLLGYLACHSGEVVSRPTLITELWPDMDVSDEVVTRAIFSLRNALADDAKRPRYIETVPKKGYRFLVEATALEKAPQAPAQPKPVAEAPAPAPVKPKVKPAPVSEPAQQPAPEPQPQAAPKPEQPAAQPQDKPANRMGLVAVLVVIIVAVLAWVFWPGQKTAEVRHSESATAMVQQVIGVAEPRLSSTKVG